MSTGNSIGIDHAVNLVSLENHVFELHLEEFKHILENESIKDRYVVIVSIAGAFRKGKSFLMNFFLKYLYAQVMRTISIISMDVSIRVNLFYLLNSTNGTI